MAQLALILLGVLGAAAGTAVYGLFARDLAAARERASGSGTQIFASSCGRVEYALNGDGPRLLVIHGTGGGFDQALDFSGPLMRAGCSVLAPSRFGYLRSSFPQDASPARQPSCERQPVHT
jgi:hypothetical protein